jgi:hypothetical protein
MNKPDDLTPSVLFEAALIRDEHYDNLAYIDGLKRSYHFFLGVLLVIVLSWLYYALLHGCINLDVKQNGDLESLLTGVVTFGLFGAIFSVIVKELNSGKSARIPETALSIRVTLLRIVLGAGSALVVYAILKSELVMILNKEIAGEIEKLEPISIYVIAFASGFTERLALNAIERIIK